MAVALSNFAKICGAKLNISLCFEDLDEEEKQ
jgi:hypothetical protein